MYTISEIDGKSKNKEEKIMAYGKTETWKVVYYPKVLDAGRMGVAFVEAETKAEASYFFKQQYEGEFHTISSIEKLG